MATFDGGLVESHRQHVRQVPTQGMPASESVSVSAAGVQLAASHWSTLSAENGGFRADVISPLPSQLIAAPSHFKTRGDSLSDMYTQFPDTRQLQLSSSNLPKRGRAAMGEGIDKADNIRGGLPRVEILDRETNKQPVLHIALMRELRRAALSLTITEQRQHRLCAVAKESFTFFTKVPTVSDQWRQVSLRLAQNCVVETAVSPPSLTNVSQNHSDPCPAISTSCEGHWYSYDTGEKVRRALDSVLLDVAVQLETHEQKTVERRERVFTPQRMELLQKVKDIDQQLSSGTFTPSGDTSGTSTRLHTVAAVPRTSNGEDPYQVLQVHVTGDTTMEDIMQSFKKLAVLYHPDKQGGSHLKMADINEAFGIVEEHHMNVVKKLREQAAQTASPVDASMQRVILQERLKRQRGVFEDQLAKLRTDEATAEGKDSLWRWNLVRKLVFCC